MEKELTNEELLKALTYCCDGNGHCEHREDCPLRNESACTTVLARYSLELIHRQKAEIERLTEENTAKEILTKLQPYIGGWVLFKELAKQYGVEVE